MTLKTGLMNAALATGCIVMSLGVVGCGPQSTSVSDQALATAIQSKLYASPAVKAANVTVGVVDGVVKLTGDAPSPEVALQVVNIANGTSGIKSVDNELKVIAAAAPAPAAAVPAPVAAVPAPAPSSMAAAPSTAESVPPPPVAPVVHKRTVAPVEHEASAPAAPRAPRVSSVTIPAGTNIHVTMIDGISSKTNTEGQTFRASLSSPVVVGGRAVLPSGSDATVLLSSAKGAGRIKGSSELEVRLVSISHAGHSYKVDTNVHDEVGKGRGKQTAVKTGIGAAAGAVIGAIAGGGKGAAIGTLAGGGAGVGYSVLTHGQQVTIPSESRLTFSLESPVVVSASGARAAEADAPDSNQ